MSLFALLFGGALVSPLIKNMALLKLFALLILLWSGYALSQGAGVGLVFFEQSSYVRLFEAVVLIVSAALILHLDKEDHGTITQLLFIAAASMALLESTTLLSFVITFEAVSIISFVLVSNIKDATQAEGAIKMFFAGALASGIILFGLGLFAVSGHDFNASALSVDDTFGMIALFIILIGIFYKLTIFPMHTWAADTYAQVSHTNAAILSAIVKTVVALATFKIFMPFLAQLGEMPIYLLAALAVITMTLGNILALYQKSIARILAYSSIAHAGYMLIPFAAVASTYAPTGLLYIAVAYIFMQSAVFLVLEILRKELEIKTLDDLKGLGQKNPLYALLFTVQLFSLAGIPLLAGFIAKAVAFYAGVDAGLWPLIMIALLNSALSVGYYAWIVKHIYFDEAQTKGVITGRFTALLGQLILLGGTIYFGVIAADIFGVLS